MKLHLIGRIKRISIQTNYTQNIFGLMILIKYILNAERFSELMHDIKDERYRVRHNMGVHNNLNIA